MPLQSLAIRDVANNAGEVTGMVDLRYLEIDGKCRAIFAHCDKLARSIENSLLASFVIALNISIVLVAVGFGREELYVLTK